MKELESKAEMEKSTLIEREDDDLDEVSGGGLYEDYPEYYDASESKSHSKRQRGMLSMTVRNGG